MTMRIGRVPRKGLRLAAAAASLLTGCVLHVDWFQEETPLPPGYYRGDHGSATLNFGTESALILEGDGSFRYFLMDSNASYHQVKGHWSSAGGEMAWTDVRSSWAHFVNQFGRWDTLPEAEYSQLRNVSHQGFERTEQSWDAAGKAVQRWVRYQRQSPLPVPANGVYEFSDTVMNYIDTSKDMVELTKFEAHAGGSLWETKYRDSIPQYQYEYRRWTLAGPFLLAGEARSREIEGASSSSQLGPWRDASLDYEYALNLLDVGNSAFWAWTMSPYSRKAVWFWAEYRRVP